MGLYSMPRPAGFRALPSGLLTLDARSPWLLQGSTPPGAAGEQQPFPSTAAALIAALGSPAGWVDADVLAIYYCNTASPLVDALGFGPNLVAAGGPLTGRECVGLPDTSFASKVGVEMTAGLQSFTAPAGSAAFADPNASIVSFIVVARSRETVTASSLVSKNNGAATGWLLIQIGASVRLYVQGGGSVLAALAPDGAWHCFGGYINDIALQYQLFSDVGDSAVGNYAVTASNAGLFAIGQNAWQASEASQVAYVAILGKAITSAMRASFWRAFNLNEFSTPCAYTRAGPLVVPITSSRVACYGANQPAVGYAANASAGDNALKTSVVCEDGITFEPIGSTDINTNWGDAGGGTHSAADGPSGMRDASRVVDAQAISTNLGYNLAIAGASNVPWRYDGNVAGVAGGGTNCRLGTYFSGDPGGPEFFVNWTEIALAVGTWKRVGGAVTPAGAAHNFVRTFFEPTDGVGASVGTVDFAEPAVVKNRATASLGWRRVGTAAAAATATPSLSYTNVGNARYNPARGRARVRISDYSGSAGNCWFLDFGAFTTAGNLNFLVTGGNLQLMICDATPAFVVNQFCGLAPTPTEHVYDIMWDAARGLASVMEGAAVLGAAVVAPWAVPAADVTPLVVGSTTVPANSGQCHVELISLFDF